MFTLAKEPQSIGKVLDNGLRLYFSGFRYFISLSVMLGLLVWIPVLLFGQAFARITAQMLDPENIDYASFATAGIPYLLFLLFVWSVMFGAITFRLNGVAIQEIPSLTESLKKGLSYSISYLLTSMFYMIIISLGFVLLIIPGFYFTISLMFCTIFVIIAGEGPIQALKSSSRLVKGNWWRTVAIMTVIFFIYLAIIGVFALILGLSIAFDSPGSVFEPNYWIEFLESMFKSILYPVFMAISLVMYHDLKLRKQGHDLEARLNLET